MGKRADRLEDELLITQGELRAERQMRTELEDELIAAGMRPPRGAGPSNFTTTFRSPSPFADDRPRSTALARQQPEAEPTDLVYPNSTLDGGTDDADEAIRRLRNAPPPVEKRETLTEIVDRNNWERAELNEKQRKANALISRVASALQVTRWNEDGAEILEKAQRFSIFHHWLSSRLKAQLLDRNTPHTDGEVDCIDAQIAELRTVISALVAPPQLSKFLHERLAPTAVAPPSIFDVANDAQATLGNATRSDILALRDAFAVYVAEGRVERMPEWLRLVVKYEEATAVLLDLINLVLVPTMARMKFT